MATQHTINDGEQEESEVMRENRKLREEVRRLRSMTGKRWDDGKWYSEHTNDVEDMQQLEIWFGGKRILQLPGTRGVPVGQSSRNDADRIDQQEGGRRTTDDSAHHSRMPSSDSPGHAGRGEGEGGDRENNGQASTNMPPEKSQHVADSPEVASLLIASEAGTTSHNRPKLDPRSKKSRDIPWSPDQVSTDTTNLNHAETALPGNAKQALERQILVPARSLDSASHPPKVFSEHEQSPVGDDAEVHRGANNSTNDASASKSAQRVSQELPELDSDLSPSQEGSDGKGSRQAEELKKGGKTGKLGHTKQQPVHPDPSDGSGAERSRLESSKIIGGAEEESDSDLRKPSAGFLRRNSNGDEVYRGRNGKEMVFAVRPIKIGKDDTGAVAKTWSPLADVKRSRRKPSNFTTAVAEQIDPRPAARRKVSKTPAPADTKTRQDSASKGKIKAESAPGSRSGSVAAVAIAKAALNEMPTDEMHDTSRIQSATNSKTRSGSEPKAKAGSAKKSESTRARGLKAKQLPLKKARNTREHLRKKGESSSDDEDENEDEDEDEDFVKRPSQLDPVPEEDEYHVSAPRPLLPQSILMPAGNSNVHYQFRDVDRFSSFRPRRRSHPWTTVNTLYRNTKEHDYENNSDDDDTQFSNHAEPDHKQEQDDEELGTALPLPPASETAAPPTNNEVPPRNVKKRTRAGSDADESDGSTKPKKKKPKQPPKKKGGKPKGKWVEAVNGEKEWVED
ncbi:hypothetical protein LTR17_006032 [Elasticomyces elasticus]|nr:hypothetical protein LTR17_006032 [Elasticomyces elasticus]